MRIGVIGAGIGGLVVAAGLQRDGHEVTIYEQRPEASPDGAGLTLFQNAFDALDAIGLGDAVHDISSGAIALLQAGQRTPSGSWLVSVPPAAVASLRSVHRVDLHRVLTEQLQPGTLRFTSAAVVTAGGAPRVTVDERTEAYDLVIAADGIRSLSRAALGLDPGVRYAGYTAWRAVTEAPVDLHGEAGETLGRGQIFGVVPLPDNRVYWYATLSTPAGTEFANNHEEVRARFGSWHAPIPACLAATPADRVLRHDIYDLARPLSSFVCGRTVLLGDAAHAMTPNLGQGAGQGIEDAATLTVLLRGAHAGNLPSRLARYSDVRRKRTALIWQRSRMTGQIMQTARPVPATLRNAALRLIPGAALGAMSTRLQRGPDLES